MSKPSMTLIFSAAAVLGAALLLTGLGLGMAQKQPATAPPPPPPYAPRELADAELTLADCETVLNFWTGQEEKYQGILQTLPQREAANAAEQVFIGQAAGLLNRAVYSRIDSTLARDRSLKRLETMRSLNGLPANQNN